MKAQISNPSIVAEHGTKGPGLLLLAELFGAKGPDAEKCEPTGRVEFMRPATVVARATNVVGCIVKGGLF